MKTLPSPIAILGFGNEGQYALKFLLEQGVSDLTICDENESIEVSEGVKKKVGPEAFEGLAEFKTIIRSPGVHYNLPGILEAKDNGSVITSLTELALEIGRDRMTAITGSNGKTSTTGLLDLILSAHYQNQIIVGGNDRKPVLKEAMEHENWPILMEVSSFQFADLNQSPHIAGVINIKPNHMDWHENMEDYIHAKQNIMAHQTQEDWCILNANDENSAKLAEHAKGKIVWVGKKEGEYWVKWEDFEGDIGQHRLQMRWKNQTHTLLHQNDLVVKTHPDNLAFAAAVSLIHGVDLELLKQKLMEFRGMPHRIEFIREIDGIKFYNDSACTTPESAEVCIDQFKPGNLILLLGGSSKDSDFRFLAEKIVKNRVRVYLYGTEGITIQKAIEAEGGHDLILKYNPSKNFTEIIQDAYQKARANDSIVLSPACASFDMFKNAKERGKLFTEIIKVI